MLRNRLHLWCLIRVRIHNDLSDLPSVLDQNGFVVFECLAMQQRRQNLREYTEMETFLRGNAIKTHA